MRWKTKCRFSASPFRDTLTGVLIQRIFIWPIVWALLFPVFYAFVIFTSIRSLIKWENIEPYS